jgi:hypothetical protein
MNSNSLTIIDELRVPLTIDIPPTTTSSKAYKMNSGEFMFLVNKRNNSLVQIDVKNPENLIIHKFERDGPSGIGGIRGVAKFDDNTLVLVSENVVHYFYDLSNKKITKSDLIDVESGEMLKQADFTSNDYEEYCKIGSIGYFMQSTKTWSTSLGRDDPDYKLVAYYDEEDREYGFSDFQFPDDYNTKTNYWNRPSIATDGERIYLSLFSDHRVHIYDGVSQNSKVAKSKFVNEIFTQIDIHDQSIDALEYLAIEPYYIGLIYDKYRNLFYRIAKITKDEDIPYLKKNSQFYASRPMQFSVMVLDEDLNVLSETLLERDKYLHMNIVVLEAGLAISKMHPANEEQSEEYLEFDIFLPKTSL